MGLRIPCEWILDFGLQSLAGFPIPLDEFRIPQAKIYQISESGSHHRLIVLLVTVLFYQPTSKLRNYYNYNYYHSLPQNQQPSCIYISRNPMHRA